MPGTQQQRAQRQPFGDLVDTDGQHQRGCEWSSPRIPGLMGFLTGGQGLWLQLDVRQTGLPCHPFRLAHQLRTSDAAHQPLNHFSHHLWQRLEQRQVGDTVLDVRGLQRASTMEIEGKPADVAAFMPLVLINPEVAPLGESVLGEEGCLSFPEVFAEIRRPETADVTALDEDGQRIHFRCEGFLARAIQHEVDHLNGILFIDRMDLETKAALRARLAQMHACTKTRQEQVNTALAG